MVEFGLKLEDNKVEEWAGKYIDYEKLKESLEKAHRSSKIREQLESRNPSASATARGILEEEEKKLRCDQEIPTVASGQISDILGRDIPIAFVKEESGDEDCLDNDSTENSTQVEQSETQSLITKEDSAQLTYHTAPTQTFSSKPMSRINSEASLTSLFSNVTTNISGMFQRTSLASKIKYSIISEDKLIQTFIEQIYKEVGKVNEFYKDMSEELEKRLSLLIENTIPRKANGSSSSLSKTGNDIASTDREHLFKAYDSDEELGNKYSERDTHNLRESESVRRALIDLHRRAKLLSNFAIMNTTGFIKIIKKFHKLFPTHKDKFEDVKKKGKICNDGKQADVIADKMESLFANWFCDGSIRQARAKMLPKKGDPLETDWSQLRLGYRIGLCSVLGVWVCWDCVWGYIAEGNSSIGGRIAFPVFRGVGGLLLFHWCWALSAYVWSRFRVNYIFLFDFDPRIVDTPMNILEAATQETLVYLITMLFYYKAGAKEMPYLFPSGIYPLVLVLYTIKCLIFPLQTRLPLLRSIASVISAPLTVPTFFEVYVGDVFTSMVKVFQDIAWSICFFISGDYLQAEDNEAANYKNWQHCFWYKNVLIPLICLFPLWVRFNQCLRRYTNTGKRWPNLANAFKYAMSQTVTLFGAFHPLYLMYNQKNGSSTNILITKFGFKNLFQLFWTGLFVASSLYSFFWDVYMDWGLGRPKYKFLGPRLMYPKRVQYYGVIAADLFLRFMWVLTLIPPQSGARFEIPNYLNAATMCLELGRRTLWGFFRLEHEHRQNTEGFRRVDFVPLHFSTGHKHQYKKQEERVGWKVLGEVTAVTTIVVTISAASVIAAQRATRNSDFPLQTP